MILGVVIGEFAPGVSQAFGGATFNGVSIRAYISGWCSIYALSGGLYLEDKRADIATLAIDSDRGGSTRHDVADLNKR